MKRFLSILLILAAFSQTSSAQSFAVIGNGTTSNASSAFPAPMGNFTYGSRHQFLIKAAELSVAGIAAGTFISSVGFNVTATNACSPLQGWTVKVYTTTSADPLSIDWVTTGLAAFSSPTTLNVVTGWIQTTVNAFAWNGTDNLVIETCFNNTSASANASIQKTSNLTGAQFTRLYKSNSSGVCGNPASSTVTVSTRPNIRLGYNNASCTGVQNPGTATVNPAIPYGGEPSQLVVSGTNWGVGTVIQWQTSTASGGPWFPMPGATSSMYSFVAQSTGYYRAAVTCSGNTLYSNVVQVTVNPFLPAGNYTINPALPTGGGNFDSFAAFDSAASYITGHVVVNVAPGTYNERLMLGSIGGSPSKTLTVNGNGATLNYVSNNSNQKGVITLNGTGYVTITDLNVVSYSTAANQYGWGVFITGSANHDTIKNCHISLDSNSIIANYKGIVVSGTTGCNGIALVENTVNGGHTSVYSSGVDSILIRKNELKNAQSYGIVFSGVHMWVDSNNIYRPTRTTLSDFTAIGDGGAFRLSITNNKIHDPAALDPAAQFEFRGIETLFSSTSQHEVDGNMIYNCSGTGDHYYFYNQNENVFIKHNTIVTGSYPHNATGLTYGFYNNNPNNNGYYVKFIDNDISIARNSDNLKMVYYIEEGGYRLKSWSNNLRMSGRGANWMGYFSNGTYCRFIDDWAAVAWMWECCNTDIDPLYVSPENGDFTPQNSAFNGIGSAADDKGAVQFDLSLCSGFPAIGAIETDSFACPGKQFRLSLRTTNSNLQITWQSSPVGQNSWTDISSAGYTPNFQTTMGSAAADYRAKVVCTASGNITFSNVRTVNTKQFYQCYCAPGDGTYLHEPYSPVYPDYVMVDTLVDFNINYIPPTGYLRYDSVIGTLQKTIQYGFNSGNALWIDWDHSGAFDPQEYFSGGLFTIPSAASPGLTGIRMRTMSPASSSGACTFSYVGITFDFIVNISSSTPCSGIPSSIGNATALPSGVCSGGNVDLFLNGYPSDPGITLQWEQSPAGQNAWSMVPNATTAAFTYTGINANTDFRVAVTCTNTGGGTTYSNTATVSLSPSVTPTIIVSASPATICSGANVTFTATATNGGTAPVYQWKKNGLNVGTNSNTYSNNALTSNDTITCVLTSNAACVNPTTATSNKVGIVVNPAVTPAVSIVGSANPVLAGTPVTFTATPTNGGTTPAYQWKKNGTNVGTNSSTYTDNGLVNGDVITCILTSNASCASPATAISNAITMNVTTPPVITITTPNTSILCTQNISFSSTVTNAGTTPTYQWRLNGTNITGATNVGYSTNSLANGDLIDCIVTSSGTGNPMDTSNAITMTVSCPNHITALSGTSFCQGGPVTITFVANGAYNAGNVFTAQLSNGTGNFTNATILGTLSSTTGGTINGTIPASQTANNGFRIRIVSSSPALTGPDNGTNLTVNAKPTTAQTTITNTGSLSFCSGGSTVLNVPATAGFSYQWYNNNTAITGATNNSYTATAAGVYYADVTNTTGCSRSSGTKTVTVTPGPIATITPSTTQTICSTQTVLFSANTGTGLSYKWFKNGTQVSGATSSSYTATTAGTYYVQTTNASNCSASSQTVGVISGCGAVVTDTGTLNVCTGNAIQVSFTSPAANAGNVFSLQLSNATGGFASAVTIGTLTATTGGTITGTIPVNTPNGTGYKLRVNSSNPATTGTASQLTLKIQPGITDTVKLCAVTVDSATGKNLLVWNKPPSTAIDSFLIYRNTTGIWQKAGAQAYPVFSTWLDNSSQPAVQASDYYLTAKNGCGETPQGNIHRTMHLSISKGQGTTTWNLAWNGYEGVSHTRYNIYRGTTTTNMSLLTSIGAHPYNSYSDLNAPAGTVYYKVSIADGPTCNPTARTTAEGFAISSNIASNEQAAAGWLEAELYPNPSATEATLVIHSSTADKTYEIRILDIAGRVVERHEAKSEATTIFGSILSPGVYTVEINGNGQRMVKKWVKR